MELFFHDNHFTNNVELFPVPAELNNILQEAKNLYGIKSKPDEDFLLGGPNLNSINFRVGNFYLKILTNESNTKNFVHTFPAIAHVMQKHQIPTNTFISSQAGNLIENLEVLGKEYLVYVQEFRSTNFYSGNEHEFGQMISIIKKLIVSSKDLAEVVTSNRVRNYSLVYDDFNLFFQEAAKGQSEFDQLLLNHKELINSSLDATKIIDFSKLTTQVLHSDLHPHNILTNHLGVMAIIDLESFIRMPVEVFEAFSIFKLSRKSISGNYLKLPQVRQILEENSFALKGLYVFVLIELLRRIKVILDFHYNKKDHCWDIDLQKHITGLKEAKLIFI